MICISLKTHSDKQSSFMKHSIFWSDGWINYNERNELPEDDKLMMGAMKRFLRLCYDHNTGPTNVTIQDDNCWCWEGVDKGWGIQERFNLEGSFSLTISWQLCGHPTPWWFSRQHKYTLTEGLDQVILPKCTLWLLSLRATGGLCQIIQSHFLTIYNQARVILPNTKVIVAVTKASLGRIGFV